MGASSEQQPRIQEREVFGAMTNVAAHLIKDNPVVLHCYTAPEMIERPENLALLATFCRRMGRETEQGKVGLVIDKKYLAITDFDEE